MFCKVIDRYCIGMQVCPQVGNSSHQSAECLQSVPCILEDRPIVLGLYFPFFVAAFHLALFFEPSLSPHELVVGL